MGPEETKFPFFGEEESGHRRKTLAGTIVPIGTMLPLYNTISLTCLIEDVSSKWICLIQTKGKYSTKNSM